MFKRGKIMDLYQLETQITARRETLMQEANQRRLAHLARRAKNVETQPSLVQRLTTSLSNFKVNVASPAPQTNRTPTKI